MRDKYIFTSFLKKENGNDPQKLRQIELNKKYKNGDITEEEKGELFGINVFPNNPRGQELRKKEHLGLITPDEKKELIRMNQLQIRKKRMTPELQALWKRTEEKDEAVEQVQMNQAKSVEVLPDDKQEKIIWTFGLAGCNATLVLCEDEQGRKNVILTHFDPLSISINVNELQRRISTFDSTMKTQKCKKSILILAEDQYIKNSETQKWERAIRNQIQVDMLIEAAKEKLGEDIEVNVVSYSSAQSESVKNQGTLIVNIPPKGAVTYKTWFNRGTI